MADNSQALHYITSSSLAASPNISLQSMTAINSIYVKEF